MSAKVTISRRRGGDDEGCVAISIDDSESGLRIIEVEMCLKDFAESLTGLGACGASYSFMPTQYTIDNIGKKREVKEIFLEKADHVYDRDREREIILKAIHDSGELVDGWELHDDGTRSQQNGDKHRVCLKRFVTTAGE